MRATSKEDPSAARRPVVDIFAESPDTVSTPALAEAEVQADVCAEIELGGWPVCALARSCPTLMRIPVCPFGTCWRAGTDFLFFRSLWCSAERERAPFNRNCLPRGI